MNYLKQKMKEKKIVIEKSMTETELAIRTGIPRTTLSEYINGKRKIGKLEHVIAIANVLEIPLDEFIKKVIK